MFLTQLVGLVVAFGDSDHLEESAMQFEEHGSVIGDVHGGDSI